MLELMHFAQEVLEPESLKSAADEVPPRELEMAKQLVRAMSVDWEPEKYQNSYHLALMEIVEQKILNKPVAPKAAPAKKGMVGDIVEILRQSLQLSAEKKKQTPARAGSRSTAALVKKKRNGVVSKN